MQKDERDLLEVLKFELEFLEKGGYGRSPRTPWRPQYIFEDSPTCMNYDSKENPEPCSECVLMQLVPPENRTEAIPCRHIPLDATGETLHSLYAHADQHETEETVGNWLRATIDRLEEKRKALRAEKTLQPPPTSDSMQGIPLHHNTKPKCANPACPTAFHWLGGGRFFRFQHTQGHECSTSPNVDASCGNHCVKHYWLCEPCSNVFTLVHEADQGILLKLLWPELPGVKTEKQLLVAHK